MLSNRKKIAVSASLLMATAGIVASVQTAAPATTPSPASARQKAAVSVSLVPGVIGPGSGLQSSKKASWAVIGKYGTGKVGKKVVLQRKSGSSWVTADKSVVDKKGSVIFAVPDPGAKVVTYRVDGPGAASEPVSTDSWGTDADFVDEFGGSKLNLNNWSYRQSFYEPASKRECSKGDPKAVKVSGGAAKLSVLVDKSRNALCKPKKPGKDVIFGKFKYRLNANIGTQFKHTITYGVVSARIKFQPLQGQHASLWMQPEAINGGPDPKTGGSEIDIIEWFGKDVPNGGLTSFIYAPSPERQEVRARGQRLDQEPRPVPREREGRVVQALPRVLRRVEPVGLHLPHRRPGDRSDQQGRLRRSRVPDPQHPQLRLRAVQAARQGREEEPAPDDGGRLDPHLAGPGAPPGRRTPAP